MQLISTVSSPSTRLTEDSIPFTRLKELERRFSEEAEPLSEEEAFACLLDVQEVVDRSLFPIGRQVELPGHPGFVATVVIKGWAIIVASGQEGWLTLLAANNERIGQPVSSLSMAGFKPEVDEVVTIFAHPRVLGARADLFVAVRRWDWQGRVPNLRIYRANAWWEEGEPCLSPGIEDTAGGKDAWPALDLTVSDIPRWVKAGSLSMAPDLSPVNKPPPEDIADRWSAIDPGPARAVAWDGKQLAWLSSGPKLVVTPGEEHRPILLDRAGTALAIGAAGTASVAVVCRPEWGVQGLVLAGESRKVDPWEQRMPCHPVAAAVLPENPAGTDWPDIVVAARDGRLERFRYVPLERRLRCRLRLLERMRSDLKLERIDQWVDWIEPRIAELEDREARARTGRLLLDLVGMRPAIVTRPRGTEVRRLARFLGGERMAGTEVYVGRALGQALVEALASAADEEASRCPWPDPEGPESNLVQCALASWAYDEGRFPLQEEVDTALSDTTLGAMAPGEFNRSPALKYLLEHRPRNRWEGLASRDRKAKPSFRRLCLLADFAVERYLPERQERMKGRWDRLTACTSSGELWAVGAGRDGLRIAALKPTDESIELVEKMDRAVGPPGLVPACLVQVSDSQPLFVLGEHAPRARFFDLSGEVQTVYGPSGSSCAAIAVVPGSTAAGLQCLLGWNQGRRSFLEIWEARLEHGQWAGGRVAYGPLSVRNVGGLGLLDPAGEDTVELVAGDALTGELVRIRAHHRGDTEKSWRVTLDAGVTAVHVDRQRGLVLAGTVAGTTWAIDVEQGSVRWTFRLRHAVRSIRAEEGVDEGGYVILAPPNDLVVITNDHVRMWRRRYGGPFTDLAVASHDGDARLLVGAGDRLHIFRRPVPGDHWSRRTVEEWVTLRSKKPERYRHAEAAEVATALEDATASELVQRFLQSRSRRARMAIIRRLAQTRVGKKERKEILGELSWRETWALVLALPSGIGVWENDVIDKVMSGPAHGTGDRSENVWSIAVVEIIRRVAVRAENVTEVGEVLGRIPIDSAPDRAWLALEAAQAWLAAVAREVGMAVAEVPIDTVLEHLHHLPQSLGTELHLLVRTEGRTRGLVRLARWALSEEMPREDVPAALRAVADDLEKEDVTPLVQALVGALRMAASTEPAWGEVCQLIALVSEVRAPELWAALLQPAALPADLGPPLGEEKPLEQQVNWLYRAVARRSVEAFDTDYPASWSITAQRVARLMDERLRWVYRQRLDHVENIGRIRPEVVRAIRPAAQRLDATLRLIPEGRRPIGEARVRVHCPDLVTLDEGKPVEWGLYRRELRAGEAPERIDCRASCDASTKTFKVEVEVNGAGGYRDVCAWDFPMPSADDADEGSDIAPFPKAVPTAFAAAVDAVKRIDTGVAVVSADAAVRPSQLIQDVGRDAQSRIVRLDHLLAELGPGRRYPRLLRRPALLRALSGLDPHPPVREEPLDGVQAAGARRLVFWPCQETIERLLDGHLDEARSVLREVHAAATHGTESAAALIFVLPSRLAARLRRWLGSDVTRLAPATLDALWLGKGGFEKAKNQAEAWLRKVLGKREEEAEETFWRSGADLRTMHEWATRSLQEKRLRIETLDSILREWGRKDLAALDPVELAALMVVSSAVTAKSFQQLRAGMVLAQEIRTTVRPKSGSQPKIIGRVGMVLTERLIRRLTAINPRPQTVRVGGIADRGGTTDLTDEVKVLQELLGGRLGELAKPLVKLRLVERRGGHTQATSFCQCVVQSTVGYKGGLEAAYRDLTEAGHLLDGIHLKRLADISEAAADILGISPTVAQFMGQFWATATETDAPPGHTRAVNLTQALTEQVARYFPFESAKVCPLPIDRCALVGVDPSDTIGGYRFLFAWWSRLADIDWDQLDRWLDVLAKPRDPQGDEVRQDRPRLLMLGPGAERLPAPPRDRDMVVLRERDLRTVLVAEAARPAFWAAVRAHTGLARIAPFVSVGALPPGSSIFVGRRREREDVLARIATCSFLVLGPRQIGKTSLLNAIYHDLKESQPGSDGIRSRPILLSFQGVTASTSIGNRLSEICRQANVSIQATDSPFELLRQIGATFRKRRERAVFIVNEIDGLLLREPEFFQELRDLHENGEARFVLGGYVTARESLGQVQGPLFHFTSGAPGKRYFDLSVLTDEEAFELVDKLKAEPLGLRWYQASEEEEGRRQLVQRSYGVPWVIQALCMKLVELLDREERPILRLDDVRRVAVDTRPVLDHFDQIDLGELVGLKGDSAVRLAGKAILAEVARRRYFTSSAPPIRDPRLRDATPGYYSFTASDAREMIALAATSWLGKGTPTADRVRTFVRSLAVNRLLRGLTLTLIIQEVEELSSSGGEPSYDFQNHIYPLELARLEGGPERRVVDALEDLARHLVTKQETQGEAR